MNVIPGRSVLGIDIRGIDKDSIGRLVAGIRAHIAEIARRRRLTVEVKDLTAEDPVPLDPGIIGIQALRHSLHAHAERSLGCHSNT